MLSWKWIAACAALTLSAATWAEAQDADILQPFVFCYQDIELFPNYTGPSADVPEENRGVVVELVERTALQAGLKPVFVRYPWNRCLSLMRQGLVDSVVASYQEERLPSVVYPLSGGEPDITKLITFSGYYLYQRAGNPDQWDGTRFTSADLIIGAPLGYSITTELKNQGHEIVTASNTKGLLQMLAHGRLGAVAAPGAAADNLIRSNPDIFGEIRKVAAPLKINPYFIVFSHAFHAAYPDRVSRVWNLSLEMYRTHFATLQIKYAAIGDTKKALARLEQEE